MRTDLRALATGLLGAGAICIALVVYQDHPTAQRRTDRDAAPARCEIALDRLQCQQSAERALVEQYEPQMGRAEAFVIAGILLMGIGAPSWIFEWSGKRRTGRLKVIFERPLT